MSTRTYLGGRIQSGKRVLDAARTKALLTEALTDACQIKRYALQPGQAVNTEIGEEIICHVEPAGKGVEERFADKLQGRQPFMLHMPAETDIRLTDEVVFHALTYQLIDLQAPNTLEPIRGAVIALVR